MTDVAVTQGQHWQHVKRGTEYEIIGVAELQNGNVKGLREGASLAVYRGDDGKLWAREEGEFSDGRFRLSALQPRPASTVRAEALEEAARVADRHRAGLLDAKRRVLADHIAAAIRALAEPARGEEG